MKNVAGEGATDPFNLGDVLAGLDALVEQLREGVLKVVQRGAVVHPRVVNHKVQEEQGRALRPAAQQKGVKFIFVTIRSACSAKRCKIYNC